MMHRKRLFQTAGLLLFCLFLLSACDGVGPLDAVRVESPLDGAAIALPIERGRGQLAGTSASFRTRQTPQELYQAYQALEAEKGLRVTPYPGGLLIEQNRESGEGCARYAWLTVSPEPIKGERQYLLTNMEAELADRDSGLEDEWLPEQGDNAQTPAMGATLLLPYHLIAREALASSTEVSKNTFHTGVLYRIEGTREDFYRFYDSMHAYRLQKREDGFSILSYAEGFDASKALRTCPAVTFTFHTVGGNTYFSAHLD